MRNHEGCARGYHRSSKAWYSKINRMENIEVLFGMYHSDGSTSGDVLMEWILLDGRMVARLKCFEDSWSALGLFTDLIQKMAEVDSELIQEDDFCKILDECGFKDLTAYSQQENEEEEKEEMVTVTIPKSEAIERGYDCL